MSKFRTFLDKTWNRIRDFAQGRDFYRSRVDHYHIGGDEIGISKEYGLLDYKSNLNDPEYWNTVPVDIKPESGGEQVYGTETFSNWSRRAQRAKDAARDTANTWDFWNIFGIKTPLPDYVKRAIAREYSSGSLHGVSTQDLVPETGLDARVARRAVHSKTRNKDIEDLGGTVEVAGERFDVRQEIEGSKFEFEPETHRRKPYSAESGSHTGLDIKTVFEGTEPDRDAEQKYVREVPRNVFGKTAPGEPEKSYRLVRPLGSPGISVESTAQTHFGSGDSKYPARTFDTESNQYINRDASVFPSWFDKTKEEPDLNKSLVESRRDKEVQYVSELYPDAAQLPRMYVQGQTWATGSKKFVSERLEEETNRYSPATASLSKNQRFKIDPNHGTANAFYGKPNEYSGDFNFPGGEINPSLEYSPGMVDQELGLIPFCITTITPDFRTYLNFPAHLDSYDDSYSGDWDSVQYVGRAEKFYGYTGFTREISLSFKVVAANPQNLANLYSKLNRLAGATAPSYGPAGLFMRGTLASLTVGDLLRNQTGFIRNVKLSWQQDYLWELGPVSPQNPEIAQAVQDMYGIAATNVQDGFGGKYYRVPQMLDVSISFTPIEHGTVREDYNAYFVFDPKELTPTSTGTPEYKQGKKEKEQDPVTLHLPGREMYYNYDENGNVIGGGMVSDRGNGIDPWTRQRFDSLEPSTEIPFNPEMY